MPLLSRPALLLLLSVGLSLPPGKDARAQSKADSVRFELPEARVEAVRGAATGPDAPFSIAVSDRSEVERATKPAVSLAAALSLVPGLDLEDRGHLALGERFSVRGVGARASFGVRGLQVLLDGIPLTQPDGQAVTEIVEPAVIRRIEALRGPGSAFWGNGSGGLLLLRTSAASDDPPGVHARVLAGSRGSSHVLVEGVAGTARRRLHVYASRLGGDEYRDHASGRIFRAGASSSLPLGTGIARFVVHAADQDVLHPGSLTEEEYRADPTGADARYVRTASGKRSRQYQAAGSVLVPAGGGVLSAAAYAGGRDLENPLPFAYIALDRVTLGARFDWTRDVGPWSFRIGIDAGRQRDDRVNADNLDGRRGSEIDLDQRETVSAFAVSSSIGRRFGATIGATASLRADRLRFSLDDGLLSDGDASGARRFSAWSPGLAVSWSPGDWTVHAGWSTAFETPTTTELVNRPDGGTGFNPEVGPQRVAGLEIGARGRTGRWNLDVAAYRQVVRDLIGSFQSPVDGRTYFDNRGRALHAGLEAGVVFAAGPVTVSASGVVRRYTFGSGALDGRRIPGLSDRTLRFAVESTRGALRGTVGLGAASGRWGDDENTTRIGGFWTVDAGLHHVGIRVGTSVLRPFLSVENLADRHYAGSVVVNARGGRYWEPAPGRTIRLGLSARF